MKICTKCKQSKNLDEFHKEIRSEDDRNSYCKKCSRIILQEHRKTKQGIITSIYSAQNKSSKRRNHKPPTYTSKELFKWLKDDWLFDLLYNNWVNCGYLRNMKPSIDRIDDHKGYSFDNIQIMTWLENKLKGERDIKMGILEHGHNPIKAVLQLSKDGILLNEYISTCEAARETSTQQGHISSCCNNKYGRKSAGGFIWKFKDEI